MDSLIQPSSVRTPSRTGRRTIGSARGLRPWSAAVGLGAALTILAMNMPLAAQPPRLRPSEEEQNALHSAAERVANSIVRVEALTAAGRLVGSGTIVDPEGYLLAAEERIGDSPTGILVTLADGQRTAASIVSRDQSRGLVLLKLDTEESLPAIDTEMPPDLGVGQWTIAAGRPFASDAPMVSIGILSATGRQHGRAIQTDARVSPGLYGGPLLDARGNVLGITVPVVGDGITAGDFYDSGIGFAIPLEQIAPRLEKLRRGEEIHQGKLGIVTQGDPYATGTEIAAVQPQSPAAKAGLQTGDVIEQIAGTAVSRMIHVHQLLGSRDGGERVAITIRRDGEANPIEFEIELVDSIPPYKPLEIGLLANNGESHPAVAAILPDAPASQTDLQPEDQIVAVAGISTKTVEQARLQIQMLKPNQPFELTIRSGEEPVRKISLTPRIVPLDLPALPGGVSGGDAEDGWTVEELELPGEENKVRLFAPGEAAEGDDLGLLLVVPDAKTQDLDAVLAPLRPAAKAEGIVLAAIAAIDRQRWTPSEVETIGHVASSVRKQYGIRTDRIAIAGIAGGGPMALFTGMSKRDTFRGIAVEEDVSVPPVRVTQANPAEMIRILVRQNESKDLPGWTTRLRELGYPVQRIDRKRNDRLMQWNRLLGGI